jgi:SAM-dependent methyltransferase
LRALKNTAPCPVLEIGCGPGILLQELSARGFDCHALETSDDARALGTTLAAEAKRPITFHSAAKGDWNDRFSLLLAFEVLEHIEDDASAVAQWHTWLKPEGRLIISVPAHQKRWNARDVWAGHVRRYEREQLSAVLQSSGFKIERMECYGFPLANALETLGESRYKRHERVQIEQSAGVRDSNTAQSGIDRSADAKWYPLLRSVPGRVALYSAIQMQRPFLRSECGNGYVVVARKQAT